MVIGVMTMIMIGNKNMAKLLCLSPLCHGIRFDSGSVWNSSEFFSALNTDVQYRPIVFPPMDAQKRNNNIVMKLTNINPMNERIKFTECKKLK